MKKSVYKEIHKEIEKVEEPKIEIPEEVSSIEEIPEENKKFFGKGNKKRGRKNVE